MFYYYFAVLFDLFDNWPIYLYLDVNDGCIRQLSTDLFSDIECSLMYRVEAAFPPSADLRHSVLWVFWATVNVFIYTHQQSIN